MIDRVQLNLRMDGRRDLLESCKEVAASQGLSLNAWVIKQLELGVTTSPKVPPVATTRQSLDTVVDVTRQALDTVVDTTRQTLDRTAYPLDKSLDIEEATELPGKHLAVLSAEDTEFLKEENKSLKHLLNKTSSLVLSDFYVELQKLRERHREYRLKTGEEHRASIVQVSDLKQEIEDMVRSNQEKQARLDELEIQTKTLQAELFDARAIIASSKSALAESALRLEIGEPQSELADLKQTLVSANRNLPEAADLLNQLKAKRKRSTASLADVETLLEIIEKFCDDTLAGL